MKVCVLNLFFGNRPDYFDIFLMSCAKNSKFDFLFYVDFDIPLEVPANVRFIKTTFEEIIKLFQSKFEFQLEVKRAYKLCDLRPAFGEVFEDQLRSYDWWGHCDFDMIFGDLDYVYELAKQNHYAKILRQGHLTLFKNDDFINCVYRTDFSSNVDIKKINKEKVHQAYPHDGVFMNYIDVFKSDKLYCFDEYWGIDRHFYMLQLPVFREPIMADISCKSMFLSMTAHQNFFGQYFIWSKGTIIRKSLFRKKLSDSYPYIHLQKRKMESHYANLDLEDEIVINQFGIFSYTKWQHYRYVFALLSCIPNFAHLYRYYLPRLLKRVSLR